MTVSWYGALVQYIIATDKDAFRMARYSRVYLASDTAGWFV